MKKSFNKMSPGPQTIALIGLLVVYAAAIGLLVKNLLEQGP